MYPTVLGVMRGVGNLKSKSSMDGIAGNVRSNRAAIVVPEDGLTFQAGIACLQDRVQKRWANSSLRALSSKVSGMTGMSIAVVPGSMGALSVENIGCQMYVPVQTCMYHSGKTFV